MPVWRQAITSEWSPKIESACVASVRAATCMLKAVSSPAILYRFGIIKQQALRGGEGRRQGPGLQGAVHGPGRAGLGLQLLDARHLPPQVALAPPRTTRRRTPPSRRRA